jgi:hypothetical protein
MTRKDFVPSNPDAPFFSRLKERLIYLRNRRWVQLSALAVLLALAVWGFFYVRSLLPRTPAQLLELQTRALQTRLEVQDALAKLELLRAMIEARRTQTSIERYRYLIAEDLKASFERAPKELRQQWGAIHEDFKQLQADINDGSEGTLGTLTMLIAKLQRLE